MREQREKAGKEDKNKNFKREQGSEKEDQDKREEGNKQQIRLRVKQLEAREPLYLL